MDIDAPADRYRSPMISQFLTILLSTSVTGQGARSCLDARPDGTVAGSAGLA
jgi:hypothetical protein